MSTSTATTHDIKQTITAIRTLDHEISTLKAEFDRAPTVFGARTKHDISQQLSHLIGRKDSYVQKLQRLKAEQHKAAPYHHAGPPPSSLRPGPAREQRSPSGWQKVQLQRQIDELYHKIGELNQRIGAMPYTPQRKALAIECKGLIQQRRRLIAEINGQ